MEDAQPRSDSTRPRLKIAMDDLIEAFEFAGPEYQYYVDLQTGKTVMTCDPLICGEIKEFEETDQLLEEDPGRFAYIEPMSSREGFRVMEDFVDTVTDVRAHNHLIRALERRHPFRSFKDALFDYPKLREEWFAFHNKALREYARQWLEDSGIDADLV